MMKAAKNRKMSSVVRASAAILAVVGGWAYFELGLNVALQRYDSAGYTGSRWEEMSRTQPASNRVALFQNSHGMGQMTHPDSTEMAQIVRTASSGAFADSMRAIFGDIKITTDTTRKGAAAVFHSRDASIVLSENPEAFISREDVNMTIAHEMGHAWQAGAGEQIGEIWDKGHVRPPEKDAINYASAGKMEHQAEAVAAAIGFLSVLNNTTTDVAAKVRLGHALEKAAPGTLLLSRYLLSHPIYAAHPWKGKTLKDINLSPIEPPEGWSLIHKEREPAWSGYLAASATGEAGSVVRESVKILRKR